jgi:hypothetical protein
MQADEPTRLSPFDAIDRFRVDGALGEHPKISSYLPPHGDARLA